MNIVLSVVLVAAVVPPNGHGHDGTKLLPLPLRFVDHHWTAYQPPSPSMFPEGTQIHIVERGDTLWTLAEEYLGDPYLWPQLLERNPYIKNAHFLYPGDPIVVGGPNPQPQATGPCEPRPPTPAVKDRPPS